MGMQSLYTGLSGLIMSSNALNTTANNLANVNTKGYVRQQVVYQDTKYNTAAKFATNTLQVGLGVNIQEVSHVRDLLLDKAYRKENGREAYYSKLWDSLEEIQAQFGELDTNSYHQSISDLLSALNEIAKTPDDNVARAALVQSAVQFVDRSQSIYSGLITYQSKLQVEIENVVDRINFISEKIKELNRSISSIEVTPENAHTFRDERDLLLDELSEYMKIEYSEDERGIVTVIAEGVLLCNNMTSYSIGLKQLDGTDLFDPVWTAVGERPVYQMGQTISTEKNTDIGGLKGLLAARGNISAKFYNTVDPRNPADEEPVEPKLEDYNLDDPDDSLRYAYDLEHFQNIRDYLAFEESARYSPLVRTLANFDKLVNAVAEGVNDVLCPEEDFTFTYTDADGNQKTYSGKILDREKGGRGMDKDETPGLELFSRQYCDRYTAVVADDGNTYYVRNDINDFGNICKYTTLNLQVNPEIIQDFTKIPLTTFDNSVDYAKAKNLVTLFSDRVIHYEDGLDTLSFEKFYEKLIDDIGNQGQINYSMMENQSTLAHSIDNQRQEVTSVSSDEELANMIKYQQAYNAASRYINVITTMMDTVINIMQ